MFTSSDLSIPAKSFTNLGGFGRSGIFCENTLLIEIVQNKTKRANK
jgi:hypothetical protein